MSTWISTFTDEDGHPKEFRNVITYEKNGQKFGPYNRLSKKLIKKECSLESYVVNLSSFRNIKTVEVQLLDYMNDKFILYENNFDDFYNLLAQSLINRSWKIRIYWKNQTSSQTNKQITKVEKV
jgi:GDP-D-mannose dehydratase